MHNVQPTYGAIQYRSRVTGKLVPFRYSVYEYRHTESEHLFDISTLGIDLVQELCKRGIPREAAKTLCYEMS